MKPASEIEVQDYRIRRGEISAYGRAARSCLILRRLVLVTAFVVAALAVVTLTANNISYAVMRLSLIVVTVCALFGLLLVWLYTKRHFIRPNLALRKWLQQVCDGDLNASIELPTSQEHYKEVHFHTKNLSSALNRLTSDMETLVESQTRRLEAKNKRLDILFNLTTDVSRESSRRTVLDTVCRYLAQWYPDAVVSAYLVDNDVTRCIAVRRTTGTSIEPFADNATVNPSESEAVSSAKPWPEIAGQLTYDSLRDKKLKYRIRIPFFDNALVKGQIVVETNNEQSSETSDTHRVLATISEQLNLFIEKRSAIERSRIAQMIRDRSELSAELHDSLAQTLAALRYQVTLLGESMQEQSSPELYAEVLRIQGSVSEANQEVRGVISEFRQPLTNRRFADSIRTSVEAFGERSGTPVFFQTNDPQISFTPREESQLLRIIGEALTNAQKYAQCSMVRVYLRSESSGVRRILIEDDGIGFARDTSAMTADSEGSHIGLTIMQDRASSIGARLFLESEPGEGTRVTIELPPHSKFDGAA
ncbi:MAG: ATP-binding protein [Granulosicoccus sp.]